MSLGASPFKTLFTALIALNSLLCASLNAHQGALHPTGLPLYEDLQLGLAWFHLTGPGIERSSEQDPLKPQEFRIINDQEPGLPPSATIERAWALEGGHQGTYSDFHATVRIGNRSKYFPNANILPLQWIIDPNLHGWQGTFSITIVHNTFSDIAYSATAPWNFQPSCAVPGDGSAGPGSYCMCEGLQATLESVHLTFPVGLVDFGGTSAALSYESEDLANEGIANLAYKGPEPTDHPDLATTDNNDLLESVTCDQFLARVLPAPTVDDPNRFRVLVSSDKLDPDNSIFRETVVENILGSGGLVELLRVTETITGRTNITEYSQPTANSWLMTENDFRRTTRTTLIDTNDLEKTRIEIEERNANGDWTTVSMIDETETRFAEGLKLTARTIDPLGKALTTTWDYYEDDEFSGPNSDKRGRNLLRSFSTPEGLIRNIVYYDNDPLDANYDQLTVTTEHFAGNSTGRVTRLHSGYASPFITEHHETLLNGVLVSRKEVRARSDPAGRYRIETDYPSATGPGLETRIDFDGNISSPLLQKTTYPDGNTEVIEDLVTGGLRTYSIHRGLNSLSPSGPRVRTGTGKTTVRSKSGQVLQTSRVRYQNRVTYPLEDRIADPSTIDSLTRPLAYDIYHGGQASPTYRETLTYGCCGLEAQTGQDGLTTHYYYDPLSRIRKIHRNGLATETIYDGLTLATHVYPQSIPHGLSNPTTASLLNAATRDLVGDITEERYRSPQDGSLIFTLTSTEYQPAVGVGRRVTHTLPGTPDDLGVAATSISESYPDALPSLRDGTLRPKQIYSYGATAEGLTTTSALVHPSGSHENEVTTQFDWLARPIETIYPSDLDGDTVPDHARVTYDDGHRPLSSTDPDGVTTLFAYDLLWEITTTALDLDRDGLIDPNIDEVTYRTQSFATNADSQLISVQEVSVRDLDASSSPITRILSRQETTLDGLNSRISAFADGETLTSTTSTSFDPTEAGKWTTTATLPNNNSYQSTYLGGLLDSDRLRNAEGALLVTRSYLYDAYQNLTDLTDSSGPSRHQDYVSPLAPSLSALTIGGTETTAFSYDHRGRRTLANAPDTIDDQGSPVSNERLTSYFLHGGIREVSGTPGYQLSYTYDHAQRLDTLTTYGAQTAVTRWNYDPARGFLTSKRHNSPTPGTGTGPSYTYLPSGRLDTRTSARGIVTSHLYGLDGRPSRLDYSDALTPSVLYNSRDRLGRPTSITDATGTRTLTYDGFQRLSSTSYLADSPLNEWQIAQARDPLGRLNNLSLAQTPGAGPPTTAYQAQYSYDPTGRPESVSAHDLVSWFQYHPTKHLLTQTSTSSATGPILYGSRNYDALNRLERISYHNGLAHTANFQVSSDYHYQRDALGRISSATLADQTQWRYRYHPSGELATATRHLDEASSDHVLGHSLSYNFDGIGNRLNSADGGDSTGQNTHGSTYTPNALNQYASTATPAIAAVFGEAPPNTPVTVNGTAATRQGPWFYHEESAANTSAPDWHPFTISHSTGSDVGHLLLAPATHTPVYDLDGNLTDDGTYHYTWDAENRLHALETATGSPQPYFRIHYTYDSEGHRVSREEFDTSLATVPLTTTHYLFAGWRVLAEIDGSHALLRTYTWGVDNTGTLHLGDPNGALLSIHDHPSNETHLASYDGNGNLTALTSAQTKFPTAAYHYSPFGKLLAQTGSYAKTNPYKFSTQHHDPQTQLPYYGYRWLDPEKGRWLSRDPIGEIGGANLYGFVGNSPMVAIDVLGLYSWRQFSLTIEGFGSAYADGLERHYGSLGSRIIESTIDTGNFLGTEVSLITNSFRDPMFAKEYAWILADRADLMIALSEIARDPELRMKLLCTVEQGLIDRYGGPDGFLKAIEDGQIGAISALLGGGGKKLAGGGSKGLRALINKVRKKNGGASKSLPARHGPLNPGPLADDVVDTFRSGSYTARSLDEPTTLYRVLGDNGNPAGSYWTATKPKGPLQSVIDSALDQNWGNSATTVVQARIPAGTQIYEGAAAAQRGLVGGGNQIYIPKVDPKWITP